MTGIFKTNFQTASKDAALLVELALACMIEALNRGEKVELRGFGSFRLRERGAHRGRNPKTGESVLIPAKRVPYFKAGKELRAALIETPLIDIQVIDTH